MISVRTQPRKWLFVLGSAILTVVLLAACGDSTATNLPAPAATTAAATTAASNAGTGAQPAGTPGANAQPGGGNAPGANGGPGGGFGQFGGQVISGTIQSYDASTKSLVVKDATGKTDQITATNPTLVKNTKLTTDDLSKMLTDTTILSVQGDKASDGTYTAREVMVVAENAGQFGGGNRGQGAGAGANGTPGAGRNGNGNAANNGTPGANTTPRAGGGAGRQGQGANGLPGLLLRGAKLADGKLTGTDPLTGTATTVILNSATVLTGRTAGDVNDLKAGLAVTIRMRPAQNNNTATEALTITYAGA